MNASILLVLLLQTSVVLGIALVIAAMAKRSPSLRLAVLRVSLLATVGLAICLPLSSHRTSPLVPVEWNPASTIRIPAASKTATTTPKSTPETSVTSQNPTPATLPTEIAVNESHPLDIVQIVAVAWILGSTALAIHLVIGLVSLAAIRRNARPAKFESILARLANTARAQGILPPELLESDRVGAPFVAGIVRPAIYLPTGWLECQDAETLDAILFHEVSHIANRDLRWSLFHRVLTIAFWFQPLLWLVKRPLIAAGEELCDLRVVDSGIPSERYAGCLLSLRETRGGQPAPSLGIGAVSSKSLLAKRVEALLDDRNVRTAKLSRRITALTRVGAIGVAAGASILFARPAARYQDPYASWMTTAYDTTIQALDERGKALIDVNEVWIVWAEDGTAIQSENLPVSDGRITIKASRYQRATRAFVLLRSASHGYEFARVWPSPQRVSTLKFGTPTSVGGRILLPSGKPATGIRLDVRLIIRGEPSEPEFIQLPSERSNILSVVTDSVGRYVFKGLPANSTIMMNAPGNFANLGMDERPKTLAQGTAEFKDIKLVLGASFAGQVTQNGKPVAGVTVAAQENLRMGTGSRGDWSQATTDSQGRYTLTGLGPSTYNIALDLPAPLRDKVNAPAIVGVVGKPGKIQSNFNFELKPGGLISGVVTDVEGHPVPNTFVGIYGPAHPDSSAWVQTVVTDKDGRYRVRVPAGKQRVYWMGGQGQDVRSVDVRDDDSAIVDLQISANSTIPSAMPQKTSEITRETLAAPQEKEFTGENSSFGPGKPTYGPFKLKNGATVKLAYVQWDAYGPHNLWQPDGSPAKGGDVARSIDMGGFAQPGEDRRLHMRVDVDGLKRGDYYCLVETSYPSKYSVWQTYGESNSDRSMDLVGISAPETLKTTDLKFGVAGGPFKPWATLIPGKSNIPMKISGPKERAAVIGGPAASVGITIEVPASLDKVEMQMEAFDKAGNKLECMIISPESEIDPNTGKHIRWFDFSGGAPDDVAVVKVGIREFEWVTFKGIHLYPNRK
ncbi:MAG: hypothetical protein BGO01_13125 [Armatimonadetes bacterium 55-13]|nr:hypothetical protein [Armatimonadota bacterium]OJU61851.1 MAG: hypothetical protein BGO01_13125 [Armatimonadetes bacterium 55-13]